MTADQALSIIATDYDTGAGGGQLSNLVHQVMKLRSQGFKAVEREQACDRGGADSPAQPGSAHRGTEGDPRVSAQAAGAVPAVWRRAAGAVPVMVGGPTPGPMPGPAPGTGAQPGPLIGMPIG